MIKPQLTSIITQLPTLLKKTPAQVLSCGRFWRSPFLQDTSGRQLPVGTMPDVVTIANPWHFESRTCTCADSKLRFEWSFVAVMSTSTCSSFWTSTQFRVVSIFCASYNISCNLYQSNMNFFKQINICFVLEWHTSTYDWHTDGIRTYTSNIRMIYEYKRATYEWHTSLHGWHMNTFAWHMDHIRVHTSNKHVI